MSGTQWHRNTHSGSNGGDCVEDAGNLADIVVVVKVEARPSDHGQ
nr:DUF397 domain-containing protein [Micromonospora pisi]